MQPVSQDSSTPSPEILTLGTGDHPVLAATAGVHGDEPEGVLAIRRLVSLLASADLRGTVIAVPVVNPAAFGAGIRTHPDDGQDLNRLFPGKAAGAPSEVLAHHLFERVVSKADVLLDLHSGGRELLLLPTALYVSGTGDDSARKAAALAFGSELVLARAVDDLPPTLLREATRAGVVAVGVEAGGGGVCSEANVRLLCEGALNVLSHMGILPPRPAVAHGGISLAVGHWEASPATGLLVWERRLGERVERGDVLARVDELLGTKTHPLRASFSGVLAGIRTTYSVAQGDRVAMIGSQEH